ncbi:hypothetical protein KIPB_001067 [Kipferlia bialata]|uniref:Aminopeptidase P N-terminal domain-containing protein n=1 Tax=Kipferlia bialata TaxID=797122 RepID=A0A9K3GEX8_9EUKA|nr:hypothetical protein KIPB_001067 [Kipferlia bialata]|eukprot:g1067.t1
MGLVGPLSVFAQRRAALMASMHPGTALAIPSNPPQFKEPGIPLPFLQSSPFLYFTGYDDSNVVLSLAKDEEGVVTERLFAMESDPRLTPYYGAKPSGTDIAEMMGLYTDATDTKREELVQPMPEFETWMREWTSEGRNMEMCGTGQPVMQVDRMMSVKDEWEVDQIRQACSWTEEALRQSVSEVRAGAAKGVALHEHEAASWFEHSGHMLGSHHLAFPPVVATGQNAMRVHHIFGTAPIASDKLLQYDVGLRNQAGYCADVSRPVVVETVSDAELDLLETVTACRDNLFKHIENRHGQASLSELTTVGAASILSVLAAGGILLEEPTPDVLGTLFPHPFAHHIGMSTHDCPMVSPGSPLVDGNCIAVEPAIYLPCADFINPKYQGMAVRLEDTVAIHKAEKPEGEGEGETDTDPVTVERLSLDDEVTYV